MLIKPPHDKYVSQLPELKLPFSTVVRDLMSSQAWPMIDSIVLGSNLGLECTQALYGSWPIAFTDFSFLDILGILTLFTPMQLSSSPIHAHACTHKNFPTAHTTNKPKDLSNILPSNITYEYNCFQTYHLPVITGVSFLLKPFPRPVFGSCSFSVSLEPQFIRNVHPSSSVLHPPSLYGQFSFNIKVS